MLNNKEPFKLSRVIIATLLAALIVIPAVLFIRYHEVATVIFSQKSPQEQLIANAVKPITGRNIYIDCARVSQTGNVPGTTTHGETPFIGSYAMPVIYLSQKTCNDIWEFNNTPPNTSPTEEQLQALITIAHEAFHTTGVTDEAQAECYALQRLGQVANELGANDFEAESIVKRAVRIQKETATVEYLSTECKDGMAYDLDPENPGVFPY